MFSFQFRFLAVDELDLATCRLGRLTRPKLAAHIAEKCCAWFVVFVLEIRDYEMTVCADRAVGLNGDGHFFLSSSAVVVVRELRCCFDIAITTHNHRQTAAVDGPEGMESAVAQPTTLNAPGW